MGDFDEVTVFAVFDLDILVNGLCRLGTRL